MNVLEPIKAQYPNVLVTNAFRNRSGTSQHNTGNAVDLQFSGIPKSSYYDIAIWISENVPHDQLLLGIQKYRKWESLDSHFIKRKR